jgi:adenylate cyclase
VMTLGLFSYSQTVQLGGDPTAGLLLTGVIALVASGIAVALALLLARSVLTPVQELERVVAAVAEGDLTARAFSCTGDELTDLGLHLNDMAKELEERDRMKTAFGKYVSTAVRDGILSGQISLGGERREVTIVFTDIRDFTTWCECTSPEEVIHTLNAYFDILVKAIAEHGGTVTRYTGDGLLALFGAPLDDPDHACHAVEAALEAQGYLDSLNEIRRAVGTFELRTGFGIHTGVAVIGSIGCETRAEYTPIGDPANVANRIEGLNKNLGTSILISSDTLERIVDRVVTGKTAETPVKGRVEPVRVYEVVGLCELDAVSN